MKALLTITLLAIATNLYAGTNYLCLVVKADIKKPDKTIEKLQSKEFFNDQTQVAWDDMARFQSVADTNIKYRVVCYTVDVGTVKKPECTKEKADKDIKDKVSEKGKVTIISCGMNPSADLLAAGYEPVPVELP